jgi:cell division protein FtsB
LKIRKKINRNKSKKLNLLGFVYRYWLTFVLIIIAATLIRQSIFINQFPQTLEIKRDAIDDTISDNELLELQNTSLLVELKSESESSMEILESQARFRFGFIKDGETYYHIRKSDKKSKIAPIR